MFILQIPGSKFHIPQVKCQMLNSMSILSLRIDISIQNSYTMIFEGG